MTLKPANSKDNSKRRYDGGGPRPDNNEINASEANERNAAWAQLSPAQQLKALDERLGKGVGAKKQRARLQNLIDNPKKGLKPGELVVVAADTSPKMKAKDRRAQERTERPSK